MMLLGNMMLQGKESNMTRYSSIQMVLHNFSWVLKKTNEKLAIFETYIYQKKKMDACNWSYL